MTFSPSKVWARHDGCLVSSYRYGTRKGCEAGRFALPQPRVAHEFSWQSFACAVAMHSRFFGESAIHQTHHLVARDQECRKAGGKQKNPRGVTHSRVVLRQGKPLVRSQSLLASSRLTSEVKRKGAPSREKWGRGGKCGSLQGACAERELSMRPETALLGQELRGRGFRYPLRQKRVFYGRAAKSRDVT